MALSNFVIFAIIVALLPNSVIFVNFLTEFSRGHISFVFRADLEIFTSNNGTESWSRKYLGDAKEMNFDSKTCRADQGGGGGIGWLTTPL